MPSSGLTALTTSSDTAVVAIAKSALVAAPYYNLIIINEGTVEGFYSIDSGTTWHRLTAAVSSTPGGVFLNNFPIDGTQSIQIKRIPSGSNLSGVFVSVL